MLSDVNAFDLPDDISGLKQPAYISDEKTYDTLRQFSPLSLIMNLSGVPEKPNAERI